MAGVNCISPLKQQGVGMSYNPRALGSANSKAEKEEEYDARKSENPDFAFIPEAAKCHKLVQLISESAADQGGLGSADSSASHHLTLLLVKSRPQSKL